MTITGFHRWSALFFSSLLWPLAFEAHAESFVSGAGLFEFKVHSGYLSGESGEYVYDVHGTATGIPGYKLSQLNWKIDGAMMVGIGATYSAKDRLKVNFDYWRNAGHGEASMDDYDWLYVGADWSDWSHTENTTVTEISSINVNGEFVFWQPDDEQTSASLLLGFKRDHFKWVAVGGYGIYSVSGYRDTHVTFPDVPGITYQQEYSTPYVGIGLQMANESDDLPVVLYANVLYSRWVYGHDHDIHHMRSLDFEESGSGGEWLALNIGLDVLLSERMALTFAYAYQAYDEIKADLTVRDQISGDVSYYPGASAGLDHRSTLLSAQLSYRF